MTKFLTSVSDKKILRSYRFVAKVNFNLTLLIKGFSTWPKSQDKELNILRTKRAFFGEIKSIFHEF